MLARISIAVAAVSILVTGQVSPPATAQQRASIETPTSVVVIDDQRQITELESILSDALTLRDPATRKTGPTLLVSHSISCGICRKFIVEEHDRFVAAGVDLAYMTSLADYKLIADGRSPTGHPMPEAGWVVSHLPDNDGTATQRQLEDYARRVQIVSASKGTFTRLGTPTFFWKTETGTWRSVSGLAMDALDRSFLSSTAEAVNFTASERAPTAHTILNPQLNAGLAEVLPTGPFVEVPSSDPNGPIIYYVVDLIDPVVQQFITQQAEAFGAAGLRVRIVVQPLNSVPEDALAELAQYRDWATLKKLVTGEKLRLAPMRRDNPRIRAYNSTLDLHDALLKLQNGDFVFFAATGSYMLWPTPDGHWRLVHGFDAETLSAEFTQTLP